MVYASDSNELQLGLEINMLYKGWKNLDPNDANSDTVVMYWFPNNYDNIPGKLKVMRNVVYRNENVNHTQPYIDLYEQDILSGFNSCSWFLLSNGGTLKDDTLTLKTSVIVSGVSKAVTVKYKKV